MRHWSKAQHLITLAACLLLVTPVRGEDVPAAPDLTYQEPKVLAAGPADAAADAPLGRPDEAQTQASTPDAEPKSAPGGEAEGASSRAGAALEPSPPAKAPRVRLVENQGARVTLHILEGTDWKPVCAAPCSFEAPAKPADFALSGPSILATKPHVAAKKLWLAPGDGLQAKYKSRKRLRSAGAILAGAGLLMFLVGIVLPAPRHPAAWGGSIGAAITLGSVLAFVPDRYSVSRCVGCGQPR